jgi:hypothetical protein
MASCAACGQTILFGGVQESDLRFCNSICQSKAGAVRAASAVPETAAKALADQIRMGLCPLCKGPGPVDVHLSHWVWSAIAMTRWGSKQQLSCRRCAVKSQLGNLAFSGTLGWWGFPWGLVMTPVMVSRNLMAIFSSSERSEPSPRLVQVARMQLGAQARSQASS